MSKQQENGLKGEELAVTYLLKQQYEIVARNWRFKRSEIDIIAKKENKLIFVEVKYRINNEYGFPEEFVTENKILKMHEAAEAYIEQNNWQGELRFDIIAVENENEIKHFEDAFY